MRLPAVAHVPIARVRRAKVWIRLRSDGDLTSAARCGACTDRDEANEAGERFPVGINGTVQLNTQLFRAKGSKDFAGAEHWIVERGIPGAERRPFGRGVRAGSHTGLPPCPASDLGWLDAVALRDLVAAGEVTAAELAESAITRIDAANPMLNAVVVPLPDVGRAIAADSALPRGPFHGVPFLLKDVGACLAGLPRMGNGLLRSLDWRAPSDTILGARFRAAGVVTVGKTALPEFGCQPTTQSIAFGACRNPWDTLRSTAGSSGGAAAAVAAGLVPVAHASDIGGSIRLPAAWCGVVGLKPSRGRTSSLPVTDPNLVEHVITRSVRDTAAFLDAVGGADPADTYRLPPPAAPYATRCRRHRTACASATSSRWRRSG